MFEYDITSAKHYDSRKDGQAAYHTWCEAVGIGTSEFPFMVKTGRMFKAKAIIFYIVSWGCYVNADNQWVIYTNYYAAAPRHTVQYSWAVDVNGKAMGTPRKYEFIN